MSDDAGIRRLLAEYCQLLDDRRFDEWADLYTVDTIFTPNGPAIHGREAVRAWAHKRFADPTRIAKHVIANALIDIDGDGDGDRATSTSDFTVVVPTARGLVIGLAGRYVDTLVRDGARWLYAEHAIVVPDAWLPAPTPTEHATS